MTTLINSLRTKKEYLESTLKQIHDKNNQDIEKYSEMELKRCGLMIKQIKTVEAELEIYCSELLEVI